MRLLSYAFQPETLVDPEHGPYVELVGISDLHAGSYHFLEKKALKHRSYILANPERKVIDLGDSVENAIHSSPGASMFQQAMPPREQRDYIREYYRPMRERVLGVVASNHPDRSEREVDWNPDETLVAFLDCPYIRWEAVLSITVGTRQYGQNYTVYMRHNISNSSKPAMILNALINKSRSVQGCDVYWGAHCHQYINEPVPCEIPDPRHRKMRVMEQHFCMSDSFLARDGSYAEQHNYPTPTEGQIALRLYRDKHLVEPKRLLY